MTFIREDNKPLLLLAFLIFLTRLPFLFAGFGSEEDAWGLILVARNIDLTGIYEVSRMPGHPVQEYLLSLLWQWPAWTLNLLTAVVSTSGVLFFMLALKQLKLPVTIVLLAGSALAFTPVYYINSTNIMDYTWALTLVLLAFYLMVRGNYLVAGIILGIACGFRVTAGAMVIPFAIWHYLQYRSLKSIFISGALTLAVAVICYIPAWNIYGSGFFTYYEYFPYPPVLKNIYKGTVGAWGIAGSGAVVIAMVISVRRWFKLSVHNKQLLLPVSMLCLVTIVLYTYSFLKIPQKSAFVLPMVPFIILLFALFLTKKEFIAFVSALVISCFFFGLNLDDPLRGSKASALSMKTQIATTPVAFDVLSGLVTADYTKRKQKIAYATTVVESMQHTTEKTVIIAGWWQNELNYFAIQKPNPLVTYLYYANEITLQDSIASGNKIYFLPEQNYLNDLRFNDSFTDELAEPFNIYRFSRAGSKHDEVGL